MENLTPIILAALALLGNSGWFVSAKKYRQEIKKARIEANREEFNLSSEYVKEFKEQVYNPLSNELQKLRSAINKVTTCRYYPECPVLKDMHETTNNNLELPGDTEAPAKRG